MKINKKHITSAIIIFLCTAINILIFEFTENISSFFMKLIDSEPVYEYLGNDTTFFIVSILIYFFHFSSLLPWATICASLLGGNAVGVITAMLTGAYTMNAIQSNDLMLINVMLSAACILFRKKNFLEMKRNIPAAALILTVIFSIRLLFINFALSEYLYSLVIIYLLLIILLLICRSIIKKTEKLLPAEKPDLETVYRKRSIKHRLLIIINVSAAILAAFCMVLTSVNYYRTILDNMVIDILYIDDIINLQCGKQLGEIKATEDLYNFDDTQLKNVLANTSNRIHITKIDFYRNTIDGDDGFPEIGTITFDYTITENGLTVTSHILSPDETSDDLSEVGTIYGEDTLVEYHAEPADLDELYSFVLNLSAIAASMFVVLNIFIIWFINEKIVIPINSMTAAASEFAYDTEEHRNLALKKFKALEICSGDEIEQLYLANVKTMNDMNYQIVQIQEQAKNISDMQHNIIMTMADIVESRDENTGGHIRRTADYVRIITEQLRENEKFSDILTDEYVKDMIVAAPLHDIGKIHISDTILNKPGKLDNDEFIIMKSHASAGREMLKNATATLGAFSYLDIAIQMAAYHHEKWNGTGYPERISGDDIPLCARIMAVADVFDALTSKRCYKEAMPLEKAYDIIRNDSGTSFDPDVVDAFFAASDKIEKVLFEFNS